MIMDHAEALFARSGFTGVTLIDVAHAANVDTGLVRYYFGDKDQLFRAIVARRAPEVNAARVAAMEAYRQRAGQDFTLEGIIRAFTAPAFKMMEEDEGKRNYGAIVAYLNTTQGGFQQLMSETFDTVSHLLIQDMRKLLPEADLEDIYWGYHFLTGAFTFSLGQTGRIDVLSGGLCRSTDLKAISERLPITIAAGIRATCESRQAAKKALKRDGQ
jgi:AcrR family transcriptional regulator